MKLWTDEGFLSRPKIGLHKTPGSRLIHNELSLTFVINILWGLIPQTEMRSFGIVYRDALFDTPASVLDRTQSSIKEEFNFQDAVDAFSDSVLVDITSIRGDSIVIRRNLCQPYLGRVTQSVIPHLLCKISEYEARVTSVVNQFPAVFRQIGTSPP